MQIEEIETGRLSTNEHNPRQVRGSRFDKLVKSLKKDPDFLKARPILYKKVDNENIVFAGNQRLLACKKLNMKTVYAIDCSMLSDEQIKRLTVLDNTHAGEWDFDMLSSFYDTHDLLELGLTEFDLKIYDTPIEFKDTAETGYQFDQRKQIEEEANRIAKEKYEAEKQKIERETKEKVLSDIKLGKQEITIDMLPKETKRALIEELKEEKLNAIKKEINESDIKVSKKEPLVNYGDIFEIKSGDLTHRVMCGDSTKKEDVERLMNEKKADMIFADPPYELNDNYSKNIINFIKDDRHTFIMNSDKKLIDNINNNFDIFRRIFSVDLRIPHMVSSNQPMTRIDLIAEFCKGKTNFKNLKDGFSTLIESEKIRSDKIDKNFGHKQSKKPELIIKFIEHYSDILDIIFDPFLGSGTTLIACQETNRNCYGMELDQHYIEVILRRYSNYMKDKPHTIICLNRQLNISDILNNV